MPPRSNKSRRQQTITYNLSTASARDAFEEELDLEEEEQQQRHTASRGRRHGRGAAAFSLAADLPMQLPQHEYDGMHEYASHKHTTDIINLTELFSSASLEREIIESVYFSSRSNFELALERLMELAATAGTGCEAPATAAQPDGSTSTEPGAVAPPPAGEVLPEQCYWEVLPEDLKRHMFSFLSSRDLGRVARTCKDFSGPARSVRNNTRQLQIPFGLGMRGIMAMVAGHPNARAVSLRQWAATPLSDSDFTALVVALSTGSRSERRSGPVEALSFKGCRWLSDGHVMSICNTMQHLKEVDLTDCVGITDAALVALAKYQRLAPEDASSSSDEYEQVDEVALHPDETPAQQREELSGGGEGGEQQHQGEEAAEEEEEEELQFEFEGGVDRATSSTAPLTGTDGVLPAAGADGEGEGEGGEGEGNEDGVDEAADGGDQESEAAGAIGLSSSSSDVEAEDDATGSSPPPPPLPSPRQTASAAAARLTGTSTVTPKPASLQRATGGHSPPAAPLYGNSPAGGGGGAGLLGSSYGAGGVGSYGAAKGASPWLYGSSPAAAGVTGASPPPPGSGAKSWLYGSSPVMGASPFFRTGGASSISHNGWLARAARAAAHHHSGRGLMSINLSGCSAISSDGVRALLAAPLPKACLLQLDMSRCPRITRAALALPATSNLCVLRASGCHNLHEVILQLPLTSPLTELHLADCKALTKLYVVAPALQQLHVGSCRHLTRLTLRTPQLRHLTASLCFRLSELDPERWEVGRLAHLNLFGCRHLEWPGLGALLVRCGGALRHLDINGCNALVVVDIPEDCAGLQHLDASGCKSLLVLRCPSPVLAAANTRACPRLQELALGSPGLTRLDISNCPALARLTLPALQQLLQPQHQQQPHHPPQQPHAGQQPPGQLQAHPEGQESGGGARRGGVATAGREGSEGVMVRMAGCDSLPVELAVGLRRLRERAKQAAAAAVNAVAAGAAGASRVG